MSKEYLFEQESCHGTSINGPVLKDPVPIARTIIVTEGVMSLDCPLLQGDTCAAPVYRHNRTRCTVLFALVTQRPETVSIKREERERQEVRVLNLLAKGLQQKEVGRQMNIPEETVKYMAKQAGTKLGTKLTLETILKGIEEGIIDTTEISLTDAEYGVYELTTREKVCLDSILETKGSLSQKELAPQLNVTPGNLTMILQGAKGKLGGKTTIHMIVLYKLTTQRRE